MDVVVSLAGDYTRASLRPILVVNRKDNSMRFSRAAAYALVGAMVVCAAAGTRAQNRERFVISAKAGGVNSVLGRVTVEHTGQAQPELLSAEQDLSSGDLVDTGTSGRVEVLLNPGSYLRAAERSRFVLTDNSLEHLTVSLLSGSCIVEATGVDGVDVKIDLVTPQSHFTVVKRGIYRLNVSSGFTELLVLKGRAIINGNLGSPVKGGNKLVLASGSTTTAKLNKKERDDFDLWSKTRAETLAQANRNIPGRAFNTFLASRSADWLLAGFGRSGIWVYTSRSLCFTFLPFYGGWGSPYGPGYSSLLYWGGYYSEGYGLPRNPVIVTNPPPGGSGGSGGSGIGSPPRGGIGSPGIGAGDPDRVGPRGKNIEPPEPNRP